MNLLEFYDIKYNLNSLVIDIPSNNYKLRMSLIKYFDTKK